MPDIANKTRTHLLAGDVVLSDDRFLRLGLKAISVVDGSPSDVTAISDNLDLDPGRALGILRSDPDLAAAFLGVTSGADGAGSVYWTGRYSSLQTYRGSLGVRVVDRGSGGEIVGGNLFGRFLSRVREDYINELRSTVIEEEPVPPGMVVTDFTPKGSFLSEVGRLERDGERFIHTDTFRPAGRAAEGVPARQGEGEAPFQSFECPFGVSYPSPLVVSTAAEASMLYERAIRGEVDWDALLGDFAARGALSRDLGARERDRLAREYSARFAWMREAILTDPSLRRRRVVAQSHLVPDESMGRSAYDPDLAPSPAHVLARYIMNPLLLYSWSANGVVRALSSGEKNEPMRFRVPEGSDRLTVLVVGSDTIGGREPGGRASSRYVRNERRQGGRKIVTQSKRYDIPLKSDAERETDYQAFRKRMDEVLGDVPAGVAVRLVTGSASTMADGVGVGVPRLVERYVREKGGKVSDWNLSNPSRGREAGDGGAPALEAVVMERFSDCFPVLSGRVAAVSFLLDPADDDSEISVKASDGLVADAAVCFSTRDDTNNRNVLSLGSYAAEAGLPVIHVLEDWDEDTQSRMLFSGAVLSRSALSGELDMDGAVPEGMDRDSWDLSSSNDLSYHDAATGLAIPFVCDELETGVSVSGYTFKTVYGAYGALLACGTGHGDPGTLSSLRSSEDSLSALTAAARSFAPDGTVPRETALVCLRRAVRLASETDGAFADRLMSLDSRDVVMPVADGDLSLFVGLDGKGSNLFGVVLSEERDRLVRLREARRISGEEERERMLQEAARRQRVLDSRRAEGQKVEGGLPAGPDDAAGAVWFIGTHSPGQLTLPGDGRSFVMWDDMGGSDRLVRAKAVADRLDDGMGGKVDNEYVFLFPTDMGSVTGRRTVTPKADSVNLTGCSRVDPATGERFVCAYGVPVRYNNLGNEPANKDLMPCSYRLDNDAGNYLRSVVLADSQARAQAFRRGLVLCLPGRERRDGSRAYTLGQVFMDKTWSRRDGWVDNPHRSPLNLDITGRYISLLERGASYPLNCVPLPKASYGPDADGGKDERAGVMRFLSDLNMSLKIADAAAVAMGVPLRFPLGGDGRVDLGPGVPDEYRTLAEKTVDEFINVVREARPIEGRLPGLEAMDMLEGLKFRTGGSMSGKGYIRLCPNDIVGAFGPFDFRSLESGGKAPLHEMFFRMGDDVFSLSDSEWNMRISDDRYIGRDGKVEYNRLLSDVMSYHRNKETRFRIRSTAPGRIPEFVSVLREYIERSKAVDVEMRLVQEGDREAADYSMEGFVNLLSSNSEGFAEAAHDIGRTRDAFNGESRGHGTSLGDYYAGREDARDGFSGYAQFRYSYDGGARSDWMKVSDDTLARYIVLTLVDRKYTFRDDIVVPEPKVLRLFLRAEAMRNLTLSGEVLERGPSSREAVRADDKVVSLPGPASVNVYAGSGENAILSNLAERPFEHECPDGTTLTFRSVEQGFQYMKSYYASGMGPDAVRDYREAVLATVDGKKLRALGHQGVTIDSVAWDEASPGLMREMVRESFDPERHPDAVKALLSTGEATLTHEQDGSRWKSRFPEILTFVRDELRARMAGQELPSGGYAEDAIVFSESSGGYRQRTYENANASGVDFTFAFAVDFSTYGERATARAAGDSLIQVDMPLLARGGADLSHKAVESAVDAIAGRLPDEYLNGEPCGVNIAGNGIYTLSSKGVTQDQCDEFLVRVLDGLQRKGVILSSVRSGGQTGVDESGAVAGVVLGVPVEVHGTSDWAFRPAAGGDVRGERVFKERFARKNYDALRALVSAGPARRSRASVKL